MAKFIKLGYKKNLYLNIDGVIEFTTFNNLDEVRSCFGWDSNVVDEAKFALELEDVEETDCEQEGLLLVLFYFADNMTFVLMKKEHFVWLTEDLLNVVKLPSSVLDSPKELTDKQADDLIDTCEEGDTGKGITPCDTFRTVFHNEGLPIVYPRYSRKGDNHFVAWAFNGMYNQRKREILEKTPIISSKQYIEEQIEGDSQYLDALIGEYEANHGVIYDSFIVKHFLVRPNFNNRELKPK